MGFGFEDVQAEGINYNKFFFWLTDFFNLSSLFAQNYLPFLQNIVLLFE